MRMPYKSPVTRYGLQNFEYANFFRSLALTVDDNPDIMLNYCKQPVIRSLLNDEESTAYERTCYLEALSYGDPGAVLASPGASLSGLMMKELGSPKQISTFYSYLQTNSARTFFALTEPLKGSDAGNLQCALSPIKSNSGQYYLNGEKCLFGNGAVGKLGIVLARTHSGPLNIRGILITPDMLDQSNSIIRENLPMTGLRGAQVGYMRFNNCLVTSDNILGEHLRPMQRGIMAVMKTFNRLRTGVGALAIGQAQAVLDYTYENKLNWNSTETFLYQKLYFQLEAVRHLLRDAASLVDQDAFNSYSISVSKVQATQIAEEVISSCLSMLDPTIMLENQWLAKCYRDCFAWEYMEGTTTMQLFNVFNNHKTKT